jgi:hypothetical protein
MLANAALRAAQAVRPAHTDLSRATSIFRAAEPLELERAQSFLELHLVARNGHTEVIRMRYHCG